MNGGAVSVTGIRRGVRFQKSMKNITLKSYPPKATATPKCDEWLYDSNRRGDLHLAQLYVPRQQGFDIVWRCCQVLQTMHDVIEWGQAIGLGCFDDAVKYRTGIGATFCVAEQPFFSANDKGLDGLFHFYCYVRPDKAFVFSGWKFHPVNCYSNRNHFGVV